MESYVFVAVFILLGIAFMFANLSVAGLFRSKRAPHNTSKSDIYECGIEPETKAWVQFDVKFYVIALMFVVFAVESAFLVPWAVVFSSLRDMTAFIEMFIFVFILVLALVYAIKTEALEWV